MTVFIETLVAIGVLCSSFQNIGATYCQEKLIKCVKDPQTKGANQADKLATCVENGVHR